MEETENVSRLPQPFRSGIPSPKKGLSEITLSASNTRNGTMLPPPPVNGIKRQGSALPEPATKRKTLAERAGEPIKQNSAAPRSNTPVSATVTSATSSRPASQMSFSQSYQSHSGNSTSSRTTSNSSFSTSLSSGIRPPNASSLARPKTSLARHKQAQMATARPTTAMEQRTQPQEDPKSKQAWDPEEQYGNMERMYQDVCSHYKEAMEDNTSFREVNNHYKTAISKLEEERAALTESMICLRSELETIKYRLSASERETEEARRDNEEDVENVRRQGRYEVEGIRQTHREELDRLRSEHREEIRELKRRYEDELEVERTQRLQAVSQASTQGALEKQKQQMELETKDREMVSVRAEVDRINAGLDREKLLNDDLRRNLDTASSNASAMEAARQALQAKIDYLESDSKSQSEAYATMERKMTEAIDKAIECEEKLRREETLRRRLHNQVQELKGNIRVFCRVRPQHQDEGEDLAKISFPDEEDCKDIEVRGPEETSSLGKVTTKSYPFSFDRVFHPESNNAEIFGEISQLIQSALDGYNVCIFAYGQTGSGKTFTMSSEDGMIPCALRQIYSTSKELESRGWKYSMEGSFVEVYNEEIRDLLGKDGDGSNKKHEIRHDTLKCETTITDVTTLSLDSQDQVEGILSQAMSKRSVAATSANERSSRSHSVFILQLQGFNSITGEKSKGTLNLVDLAGSERLKESKVEGARLKETQNINKSLSCLGDVIGALGQQGAAFNPRASVNDTDGASGHIPYRNSKLTYLLQFSLGGNSKTLMFVMVAPEKKHLSETLTSLRFAEKVSKTKIGVAKRSR